MQTIIKQLGAGHTVQLLLTASGLGVSGQSPTVEVRRLLDGSYLDHSATVEPFWVFGGGVQQAVMPESAWLPGLYGFSFNPSAVGISTPEEFDFLIVNTGTYAVTDVEHVIYESAGGTSMLETIESMVATVHGTTDKLDDMILLTLWPQRPVGSAAGPWNSLAFSGDGHYMIACGYPYPGKPWLSSDYGATWTEIVPTATLYSWYKGALSSDGLYQIVVGSPGRIYISSDYGVSWVESQPNGNADFRWLGVASNEYGSLLVAGGYAFDGGRLYTSDNGGASWIERQPEGDIDASWYALAAGGGYLIAGRTTGRLWISTDSGWSWTETQPAGNVSKAWGAVAVGTAGSLIIVAARPGRLYTSTDGGYSWTERQPAGAEDKYWSAVASNSDGTHLLACVENGRVYSSVDSGLNWTEETPIGDNPASWQGAALDASGSVIGVCANGKYIYLKSPTYSYKDSAIPAVSLDLSPITSQLITIAGYTDGNESMLDTNESMLTTIESMIAATESRLADIQGPDFDKAKDTLVMLAHKTGVDYPTLESNELLLTDIQGTGFQKDIQSLTNIIESVEGVNQNVEDLDDWLDVTLADIEGTGFVKDVNSLVNLGGGGSDASKIETVISMVATDQSLLATVKSDIATSESELITVIASAATTISEDIAGVDSKIDELLKHLGNNGRIHPINKNHYEYTIYEDDEVTVYRRYDIQIVGGDEVRVRIL